MWMDHYSNNNININNININLYILNKYKVNFSRVSAVHVIHSLANSILYNKLIKCAPLLGMNLTSLVMR